MKGYGWQLLQSYSPLSKEPIETILESLSKSLFGEFRFS
jgi:hypothetical protein